MFFFIIQDLRIEGDKLHRSECQTLLYGVHEGEEDKLHKYIGQALLHSNFEASLGCSRPCTPKTNRRILLHTYY